MLSQIDALTSEDFKVITTSGRGATPEELADRAIDRIIYVGKDANPLIKDQAEAYKAHIRNVVLYYLKHAVKSDRTTIANRLRDAGHPELISILET